MTIVYKINFVGIVIQHWSSTLFVKTPRQKFRETILKTALKLYSKIFIINHIPRTTLLIQVSIDVIVYIVPHYS